MAVINKPSQPLIPPTDVEEVEEIAANAAEAAIAADDTHAPLVDDKVPAEHLPSYVDDVLNFDSAEDFPEEGEDGKIYVANDTNLTYRWSGVAYIQVGGASLAAGDGIEIENDIVSVDMDYVDENLDHVTEAELNDALATKADKPYTLQLEQGEVTPIDPTNPAKGFRVVGTLTNEQVVEIRAHYPNIVVMTGPDFKITQVISITRDLESVITKIDWGLVLYDETLGSATVHVDLENATYTMVSAPLPTGSQQINIVVGGETDVPLNDKELAAINDHPYNIIFCLIHENQEEPLIEYYHPISYGYGHLKAANANRSSTSILDIDLANGHWSRSAGIIEVEMDTETGGDVIYIPERKGLYKLSEAGADKGWILITDSTWTACFDGDLLRGEYSPDDGRIFFSASNYYVTDSDLALKADKPYTLQLAVGEVTPIDPTDPSKGVKIVGTLTDEQVNETREYFPNIVATMDGEVKFTQLSGSTYEDKVLTGLYWDAVSYGPVDGTEYGLVSASISVDLKNATYTVASVPVPMGSGDDYLLQPTYSPEQQSGDYTGTITAQQLQDLQAHLPNAVLQFNDVRVPYVGTMGTSSDPSYVFNLVVMMPVMGLTSFFAVVAQDLTVHVVVTSKLAGNSIPHISITVAEEMSGTLPAEDLALLNNTDSADAVIEVVTPGEEISMDVRDIYRVYTRGYDTIRAINVNPEHNIGITINRQTGEWTFVAIASKQDTLVSGTNIKTINTQSVLGSGDLEIALSQSAQAEVQSMIDAAIGNVLNEEF